MKRFIFLSLLLIVAVSASSMGLPDQQTLDVTDVEYAISIPTDNLAIDMVMMQEFTPESWYEMRTTEVVLKTCTLELNVVNATLEFHHNYNYVRTCSTVHFRPDIEENYYVNIMSMYKPPTTRVIYYTFAGSSSNSRV